MTATARSPTSGFSDDDEAYDSDEAPPPVKTNNDKLLWRQDPEENFSDWSIEILYNVTDPGGSVVKKKDVYHVHKAILAAGPRKSDYFARLFKDGGRFAESGDNTSRIELDELAAKAFPQLLDYIYSVDADLEISTSSATALHHLGGYFKIRRLRWEAKQFWKGNMDPSTCGTYYEHARILLDNQIEEAAMQNCVENIMEIDEHSRLVHVPDEGFWTTLVQARESTGGITDAFSLHMSKLLGAYFVNCGASKEVFKELTLPNYLPIVHRDGAIKLFEAERQIIGPCNDSLTSLQTRCITALVKDWSKFDIQKSDVELLQQQSPFLLTKTLLAFTEAAGKGLAVEHKKFVRITDTNDITRFSSYGYSHPDVGQHPQDPNPSGLGGAVSIDRTTGDRHAVYRYRDD